MTHADADPNEQVVRFSVKELFLDLKKDLGRIESKIEHMASEADLLLLVTRVTSLETSKASADAVAQYRRWQLGIAAAVVVDIVANGARFLGLIK